MDKLCIDRFEGEFALCEDCGRNILRIPRSELPPDSREGYRLKRSENGMWIFDEEETNEAAERIKLKMDRLWK